MLTQAQQNLIHLYGLIAIYGPNGMVTVSRTAREDLNVRWWPATVHVDNSIEDWIAELEAQGVIGAGQEPHPQAGVFVPGFWAKKIMDEYSKKLVLGGLGSPGPPG